MLLFFVNIYFYFSIVLTSVRLQVKRFAQCVRAYIKTVRKIFYNNKTKSSILIIGRNGVRVTCFKIVKNNDRLGPSMFLKTLRVKKSPAQKKYLLRILLNNKKRFSFLNFLDRHVNVSSISLREVYKFKYMRYI